MSFKIYSYPQNPRLHKTLIAAKYLGITNIEQPNFKFPEDTKTEAFLQKNPFGKVPTADTPDGPLFESNSILRYVARQKNSKIYGSNVYEQSLIDAWLDFQLSAFSPAGSTWIYPLIGVTEFFHEATEKAKEDVKKYLTAMNQWLLTRTFLVGERISIADINLVCHLMSLYSMVMDPNFRRPFTCVNRWFTTCINQPEFKSVIGEFKFCEKMQVAVPKEKEEKKEEKKEEHKEEKKEQPKKQEKKPKKGDDEEEEDEHKEKKSKSVLDSLPPSKFVLEDWKRSYSNASDTRSIAMPYFWKNLDKEGFSVWFASYKHNADLAKEPMFKTLNFVGGWMQRLDQLRKYGFGSICIFGQEGNIEIDSCWLFRGLEIPEEMKEADDWLLYNWKKANVDNASDKELIEDFFSWAGKFGGKSLPFNQGKIFK